MRLMASGEAVCKTTTLRYFHVDSDARLAAGDVMVPRAIPDGLGEPFRDCIDGLFPDGVGTWGFAHLFESTGEELIYDDLIGADHGIHGEDRDRAIRRARNRVIELIAELVRVNWAPQRPSRLSSVFAYATIRAARDFRGTCTNPNAPIWQIEAEDAFGCDASWLSLADNMLKVVNRMTNYWAGETRSGSSEIAREFLLNGPVTVVARHD
jgi:hypothetical protein